MTVENCTEMSSHVLLNYFCQTFSHVIFLLQTQKQAQGITQRYCSPTAYVGDKCGGHSDAAGVVTMNVMTVICFGQRCQRNII